MWAAVLDIRAVSRIGRGSPRFVCVAAGTVSAVCGIAAVPWSTLNLAPLSLA